MPRDRREVEAGLRAKGFRESQGDHHFFTYYTLDGLKTPVFTKTSHGEKEIRDDILSKMARQCRIDRAQFLRLVSCPLSRADYETLLRECGAI